MSRTEKITDKLFSKKKYLSSKANSLSSVISIRSRISASNWKVKFFISTKTITDWAIFVKQNRSTEGYSKLNQIKFCSEELWPGHGFPVCVHCGLDLEDMTLGQGHDTPLGHGQQLCEIISRLDKGIRSHGPDTMWTDRQTRWFLFFFIFFFFFFFFQIFILYTTMPINNMTNIPGQNVSRAYTISYNKSNMFA